MKISDLVEPLRDVPGTLREAAESIRSTSSRIGELEKTAALRRVKDSFSSSADSIDSEGDKQTIQLGGRLLEKLAGKSARRTVLGEAGDDAPGGAQASDVNYLNDLRSIS
jgi:hypothetical protein